MTSRPPRRPQTPARRVVVADERLWGRRVRAQDGWVEFVAPDDDEGGAGVREPRRPSEAPPALSATAEVR